MTHRDRAGDPPGRREAAGDAGHRQGFPTPSGGSPARPERRFPKAFGRRRAWLPMSRIATPRAPSRKPWETVSMGHYLRTFGISRWRPPFLNPLVAEVGDENRPVLGDGHGGWIFKFPRAVPPALETGQKGALRGEFLDPVIIEAGHENGERSAPLVGENPRSSVHALQSWPMPGRRSRVVRNASGLSRGRGMFFRSAAFQSADVVLEKIAYVHPPLSVDGNTCRIFKAVTSLT